ncbi:MAG: ATP-binding cassette domain-containing protein [Nitrospirae bacterium]|nr:MAG: ATP-binding cassette domain-containing protein [Nitrospirota bacterium]
MPSGSPEYQPSQAGLMWDTIARLGLLLRLERKIFALNASYALAIGLFSLIIPLTVQEMVNTFAYAIQPIMILTLVGIMAITLIFVGGLKVLQSRTVDILAQRLYTRISVALTKQLPRFKDETFATHYVNYFNEAEFMPRAFAVMLVDLINVTVGGIVGMTLLVMYHPYFLVYNSLLLAGFVTAIILLGRGGLRLTMKVSDLHYETLNWLQNIADNLLPFKSTASTPLLLKKTDALAHSYVAARKTRSDILHRQYKGSVVWQALGHSSLIGMAGWLLSTGQITLGQFVAAEVVVSTLLLNFDTVARRIYAMFFVFTSLANLSFLFSLPKDHEGTKIAIPLPDPTIHGIRLTCKDLSFAYPDSGPVFQHLDMEISPGEKIAIFSNSSTGKTTLAMVLAGLYTPTSGVIRYNGVDVRDLDMESLNACRGLILDSRLSLFDGTLEENITLGRPAISYSDVLWALRFVEMEEEVDALPLGLQTPIKARGKAFTSSQVLRILVARAIVARPQILILDGTLHSMQQSLRETLLRRLCSKEEPWSVIFVSNDPTLKTHVDRRLMLD